MLMIMRLTASLDAAGTAQGRSRIAVPERDQSSRTLRSLIKWFVRHAEIPATAERHLRSQADQLHDVALVRREDGDGAAAVGARCHAPSTVVCAAVLPLALPSRLCSVASTYTTSNKRLDGFNVTP